MVSFNLVYITFLFSIVQSISLPPTILEEPNDDIILDPRTILELPCLAKGDPVPMYTWIKNGRIYDVNGQSTRIFMANDSGTLTFSQPESLDQGWYQCNASNIWGTAMTRRVSVRLPELGEFPVYDRAQLIQIGRGESLKVPCNPPSNVPNQEIYWTDSTLNDDQVGLRVTNPRIQQDDQGNLYFLNVKDEDEQKQFVCNVLSHKLNIIRRGSFTRLQVVKSDPIDRKPKLLWAPESQKVFLKGQKLSLKCIFGGLPTPDVIWRKINGIIPARRSSVTLEQQELVITDLQYDDAGQYECRGYNELGYDTFSIDVRVESSPYWIEKPRDIHVTEGETVDVSCNAESKPAPKSTQWLINGIPLQDTKVPYNPRRRIMKNRMIIRNATKLDTAVYQCNVSNVHGYIYANFFINIVSIKATIQREPDVLYNVVEGQNIILPCEAIGVPLPKVYWNKFNQTIKDLRYSVSKNGSLTIRDASISDSGLYVCNATNKFGSETRNTTLSVKQKTRIETRPSDQQVRRGYQVAFRCKATVDSSLTYNIDWYKDGELLTYTGRVIKDVMDENTLKIVDVQFDDAGSYMCRASTEFDFDDASATLIVQDRPNRPKVTKVNCNGTSDQPFAIVEWQATGDNNARILYYELQYNTSFQTNEWISVPIEQRKESFKEVISADGSINLEPITTTFNTTHIPLSQNDLRVSLSCWANYTFRVIAYNRVGPSDPNSVSDLMCSTQPCRPKMNPIGVKASSTSSIPLLIEWDSLPQVKWGAPSFWYEVGWRQFIPDTEPGPFSKQIVYPPQRQFIIPNPVMNNRYQYYVKAVNQQPGETNSTDAVESPMYNIAYSGDSEPTYVPRNFRVLQMLDSTTVQFAWDPPLPSDGINIRGTIKAYQIEIFRLDDPGKSRQTISDILPNQTWTTVFNAPPNADVGAHIRIETERYFGPTSPIIQFPTREGRPGPITNLRAVPYTSNGILLFWDSPDETNGIIIGYQIDYKPIESIALQPGVDQPSILLRDDTRRSYLLSGLKSNTKYRVQVRARTSVGLSTIPAIVELTTNLSLAPSKPTFTVSHRGRTSFNVSFDPTIMTVPGSVYYVEYKENDQGDQATFKQSYAVSNDRTILVNSLEPGKTYTTILVAGDGISAETKSDPQMISTLSKDPTPRVINSPWFIGLIVSVIVLIIIFAIVCGIMRRKGGKYSVQDKEMLHGPSGYGDNDGKFSEYYRAPSDASIKQSRTSLNNGDDRDSMAEFNDDRDRSRFTEDGSFIGQYGRDDKRHHACFIKYDDVDGLNSNYPTDDQTRFSSHA